MGRGFARSVERNYKVQLKMKKYDIFISYRREGGYDTAKHLSDLLTRDGYRVSFDIDTLRSGDFDTQLYERIDLCKDFILIVDQHAFDRTIINKIPREKDWLRCELAYALKKGKNVIPVFLSGINRFPDGLPDDISGVAMKNGPEYNRYYFNDFYRELKKRFLHSRKNMLKNGFLCIIFICIVSLFMYQIRGALFDNISTLSNDSIVPALENEPCKTFVRGLKSGIEYHPVDDEENNGAIYHYSDGRKIEIKILYLQMGFVFSATDESGEITYLPVDFGNIGHEDNSDWDYSDNEYVVGQYDLDGDDKDELIVAVRTSVERHTKCDNHEGLSVNVFKLVGGRWELLSVLETNSNIHPINVKLIKNNLYVYWQRYDEKFTFVNNKFVSVENETRVFKETDFE